MNTLAEHDLDTANALIKNNDVDSFAAFGDTHANFFIIHLYLPIVFECHTSVVAINHCTIFVAATAACKMRKDHEKS